MGATHVLASRVDRSRVLFVAFCISLAGISTSASVASASPVPGDPCPNGDIRQAQGSAYLPDCMAFEMVTPPAKGNVEARTGYISADGERIQFLSSAALGDPPNLVSGSGDRYIASRGQSGWSTSSMAPPPDEGLESIDQSPQAITPDFTRWIWTTTTPSLSHQGFFRVFEGGLGGIWNPRSPLLVPADGSHTVANGVFARVAAATHSLSHLLVSAGERSTNYLSGDPVPSGAGGAYNTYLFGPESGAEAAPELLARDEGGTVWGANCGTVPGGAGISGGKLAQEPWRSQGAISIDGSVAYFTTRPANVGMPAPCDANSQLRILRRSEDSAGAQIDHVGPELPTPPGGHDFFQGASVDGTKIYFTTTRPLVAGDLDAGFGGNPCGVAVGGSLGCDLYLYDSSLPAGEQLIQVSAGEANSEHPTVGADANVLNGVTAISGDGARVYFVAQGVLTEDAGPKGTSAAAGQPNLYVWHEPTETTAFIGTLVEPDDRPKLWGSQSSADHHANAVPRFGQDSEGNEVGGDGRILTFVSRAPLTGDDVGDGGHSDVFRYDALTEELIRISKAALGGSEEPFADVEIENFSPEGDQVGRWTSEDGRTIAFSSAEPLSPGDADSQQNPFLWRDGDLVRLPGTINRSTHPKVSPNGNEVSFQTASSLLPQDGDTARDIYVARIDGGFPPPPIAEACQGEACQGAPASPPVLPGVQTNAFAGSGNLQAGGKPRCGKGKVRRKGRCVSKRKANRKTHSRANRRAAK